MTIKVSKKQEKLFQKAIDKFQDQFNCILKSTGFSHDYDENDGIAETEYWAKRLITGPLNFEVGGWFSHDTRDGDNNIYCLLAMKLDGENLGECKGLQAWYDNKTGEWSELKWDSF